jgi:hypothetical protein
MNPLADVKYMKQDQKDVELTQWSDIYNTIYGVFRAVDIIWKKLNHTV